MSSLLLAGQAIQLTRQESYGDKQGRQVLGQDAEALQTIRQGGWWRELWWLPAS
jgi:hypothetical protein